MEKSKRLPEEIITTPTTSGNRFFPKLIYVYNSKIAVKIEENCLKQDKVSFTRGDVGKHFIVYGLDIWLRHFNADFTLSGTVRLNKNDDPDKYFYSGYCIGFDSHSISLIPIFNIGKKVIILDAA